MLRAVFAFPGWQGTQALIRLARLGWNAMDSHAAVAVLPFTEANKIGDSPNSDFTNSLTITQEVELCP